MATVARFDLTPDAEDTDVLAFSLIESESRITFSRHDFATFMAAIDRAFTPNAALQDALQAAAKVCC